MRRKSERTVKASPTKKAESTPRRTSRRTRKTPEKSINDDESDNNSSDQGSSSENETEEVVAPKRSRRSSRTIEKSSSTEDLKQTRPRRKAATKKEADTIEEDPNEDDQLSTVDNQSKNENMEIEEKPVESSSTENVESASVDSSIDPKVANDDKTDINQKQNEIIQTNEKIECLEEKQQQQQQQHDSKDTENLMIEIKKKDETPIQSTKPETDAKQPEAPKEKPTKRRALKRTEKEPISNEKLETVNESENNECVKETNVDGIPTEPKPDEDSELNKKNTDETKIKRESSQQLESVEMEPKENGEAKQADTNVAKAKQQIVRKRKWLSNKPSAPKIQEITISTDSLKGLISDVKPVPLSDVKLESSPEADHESDDVKVVSSTSLDYNNRRSEERICESPDDAITISTTRKISIVSEPDEQQPLSPAKHNPCNILFITNLVRPFTVLQLKSLLQRTGKIVENGFWMDKIKSKCFVKYETEDEAVETRHALHGIRWPSSNPKCLNVDFGTESLMEKAIESTAGDNKPFSSSRDERVVSSNDLHESNRERIAAERPIREWDLGKKADLRRSRERDRTEKDHETGKGSREKDRDRRRRSASASPSRKYAKKEAEPPLRLLDDLFRKTKTTPCIYWLPLTPEQIAVREEERQKTIQRRLAMKKEREREEIEEKERRRQREKRNSHDRERDRRPARENSRDRNRRDRPNDRRRY